MRIRKGNKKDTIPASELISKTFAKFNVKEGNKKAIRDYINFYNHKKNIKEIKKNFLKCPIFWVVEESGKIVGIIRGNKSRIVNLFVDGKYHKKGIGRRLIKRFEDVARKLNSNNIKVRASLYSVNFYLRSGYKKTTGVRNMNGIKIQPMRKILK